MDDTQPGARSHHQTEPDGPTPAISRRSLIFAGFAAAATVGYSSYSSARSSESTGRPPATSVRTTAPTTAPSSTTTTAGPAASSTTTTTIPPLTHDIGEGMVGSDVETLQAKLSELKIDPGPIDGVFGGATLRSVWAFEKIVLGTPREQLSGIVTPAMWERMHGDVSVDPRRAPGGTHMEVYLPEQVSVLFVDGQARVISHVSSGEGVEWCDVVEIDLDDGTTEEKGICGISITPGGVYHFERKVEGWRNAKLGRLYQPIYFNYGIAIHGSGNVPAYPASRGCVRHPMHIAEYLPDLIDIGDAIYVFDGIEEPEVYGAQPMIFDYPDPDWVPPTTTTTSTTTTTVPPEPARPTAPTAPAAPASSSSTTTTSTPGSPGG